MIKNTKAAAGVTATSPFLTIEQAAAELALQPIDVLRLIALGRLSGTRVGEHWKVTPQALEKFVAFATNMPKTFPLDATKGTVHDPDGENQFHWAKAKMQTALDQSVPDSLASLSKDATGNYPPFFQMSARPLQAVLGQGYMPLVRMADAEPTRYPSLDVAFAAVGLRKRALSRASKKPETETMMGLRPPLERLFESPQEYDRRMREAWESFQSDAIVTRKLFPAESGGEQAVSIGFRVPISSLGLDYRKALEFAF